MQTEQEQATQYIYVEPMGHGSHFVAEIGQASIIPGTVQLNVLRGDGSIDRTIGMNGNSIFRWTSVNRESAIIIAQQLEQRLSMYDVSIPQRLLLEAARSNQPSESWRAENVDAEQFDDADDDPDDDDEPKF